MPPSASRARRRAISRDSCQCSTGFLFRRVAATIRHSFEPPGMTSRYSPPPSNTLKDFAAGFAFRIARSVKGAISLAMIVEV